MGLPYAGVALSPMSANAACYDGGVQALVATIDAGRTGGPRPVDAPPPWITWLAVAVMRQRVRQAWHRRVINGPLAAVHDDEGAVPGHAGWTFARHGIGCTLIGPDGETIDVDQHDRAAAIIDPWFFAWRLASVRTVALPEQRVWRWLPSDGLVVQTLAALRATGALVYPDGNHLFRLAAPLDVRSAAVAAEDFTDPAVRARWTAALGDDDSPTLVAAHQAWLLASVDERSTAGRALEVLATVVPVATLVEATERVLRGPVDPVTGAAVRVLRQHPARPLVPAVVALLPRLDRATQHPVAAYEVIAYLLEHGVEPAAVDPALAAHTTTDAAPGFIGQPFLGDYAVLALLHRPAIAMALVRRALRGRVPISVRTIATTLHVLDQGWCRRELAAAAIELDHETLDDPPAAVIAALRGRYPEDWDKVLSSRRH